MSLLLIVGKGAGFLVLLALILFALGLMGCFMSNSPHSPTWAKVAGGVITFIAFSAAIGLWMR